jgi:DNA-binding MurR/RpiR family transcriptional regulator
MNCFNFGRFKDRFLKGRQKYNLPLNNQNIIREKITDTLLSEANALLALSRSVDDNLIRSVEQIFLCTGSVVVTGIGKSAIVAQKMVATFNSTGTNAVFMHAADAIHGDLGIIKKRILSSFFPRAATVLKSRYWFR